MKLRMVVCAALLSVSIATLASDSDRRYIALNDAPQLSTLTLSDGVLVDNTLYVAGHVGLDPKTDKPAVRAEDEARFAMEGVKKTINAAGMSMDDLVSIQVFCTDMSLYNTFNQIYRTYFHGKYPGRAFIGVNELYGHARFEVLGIAVKKAK